MSSLFNGNIHKINGMYYPTDLPGKNFQARSLIETDTFGILPGMKTVHQVSDLPYNTRFGVQEQTQNFSDSASVDPISYRISDGAISGPSSYMDRVLRRDSHTRKAKNLQDGDRSFYHNMNEEINVVSSGNVAARRYFGNDNLDISNKISRNRYKNNDFDDNIRNFYIDENARYDIIKRSNEPYSNKYNEFYSDRYDTAKKIRNSKSNRLNFDQIME
jgi:hypothetical protein